MFLSLKILVWIFILEILLSQNILKHLTSYRTSNFVLCFIHKDINSSLTTHGFNTLNNPKVFRNNGLLSKNMDRTCVTFGNISNSYMSNLNRHIKTLNHSIVEKNIEDCYNDIKYVFELFSGAISSLYSEPTELDFETKLGEIRSNFGYIYKLPINHDKPNHLLTMKMVPDNHFTFDLAFEYITTNNRNGSVSCSIFRRDLLEEVPLTLKKQLSIAFVEFSRTLGNFLSMFYTSEFDFDDVLNRATKLGLVGTVELFEGLSLLELASGNKKGYTSLVNILRQLKSADYTELNEDPREPTTTESTYLSNCLTLVDYFSNFFATRNRFYTKLIGHFFQLKDPDSILLIIKSLIRHDKKMSSVHLTQYLVSLAHQFKKKLSKLNTANSMGSLGDTDAASNGANRANNQHVSKNTKELYHNLKDKIKEVLAVYKENQLHTFNLTDELAEIIEKNYNDIAPGLFKRTSVASGAEPFGTCKSCSTKIGFQDISESDRFDLFSNLIKTIHSTSPNELIGLYEFYEFLLRAKESGNPYTCVIDGQNVGYCKSLLRVLSWFKIYYSYSFMKALGENVLIVLPEGSTRYISTYLQRRDPNQLNLLNQLIETKAIYKTKRDSYDDNFFLLAGISSFSKQEREFFKKYVSNITDKNSTGANSSDSSPNSEDMDTIKTPTTEAPNQLKANKSVIILTNDKLTNLNIDGVNQEILERWKDYSLINFKLVNISNREMFVLGQRLKYTLSMVSDDNLIHIPIGYDRVFTNTAETLKCAFEWTNVMHTAQFNINLIPQSDTPIKKWIKTNYKYLYNIDDNPNSANADTTNNYFSVNSPDSDIHTNLGANSSINSPNRTHNKNYNQFSDIIHHKLPELAKLMFSPYELSSWLCIDLNAIEKAFP